MLGYTRTEFVEKFENRFSYMVYEQDRERVLEEIDSQIEKDGDYDTCFSPFDFEVYDDGFLPASFMITLLCYDGICIIFRQS